MCDDLSPFDFRHFSYRYVGKFLEHVRILKGVGVRELCTDSGMGKDTYYKLIKEGKDMPLSFYLRLLEVLADCCSEEELREIFNELILLARAEVCKSRQGVLSAEMVRVLAKWE